MLQPADENKKRVLVNTQACPTNDQANHAEPSPGLELSTAVCVRVWQNPYESEASQQAIREPTDAPALKVMQVLDGVDLAGALVVTWLLLSWFEHIAAMRSSSSINLHDQYSETHGCSHI